MAFGKAVDGFDCTDSVLQRDRMPHLVFVVKGNQLAFETFELCKLWDPEQPESGCQTA